MPTYMEVAARQLTALCRALELDASTTARHLKLQQLFLEPWAERELGAEAPYPCAVADDHSPYEYSLALTRGDCELRLLVEPQAPEPSLSDNRAAAVECLRRVASRFGLGLERFERVAPLFLPENPRPPFSLWLGESFPRKGAPEVKVYLNPQVRGPTHARAIVADALRALDLDGAERILDWALSRGDDLDEIKYFSLDLSARDDARVKVYVCHHRAKALELERVFSAVPTHRAGDVSGYCATVLGWSGPFERKPVSSCLAFVRGQSAPRSITLHFPVAHYLSESAVVARTVAFLEHHGIAPRLYLHAWTALVEKRRNTASPVQSYLSYRREPGGVRVTAYLSPCLFRGPSIAPLA